MRFENTVVAVTGSGRGIGREEARLFAAEGAHVVVNDLGGHWDGVGEDGRVASEVVKQIEADGGHAVADTHDISTMSGAAGLVDTAISAFGKLDVLVNNATVIRPNDAYAMTEEEWDKVVAVNLKGAFATMRAAAPHFCQQGSGVILNTSSEAGLGLPAMINYAAAKEGIVGLTRTLAQELARFGVRVNAIRPRAATKTSDDYLEQHGRWNPLHGAVQRALRGAEWRPSSDTSNAPEDVANVAVWLCSDAAANINGRTFLVHGSQFALYREPDLEIDLHHPGGWTLDELDARASAELDGLRNSFAFDLRLPGEESW